jgi:hypothetical protein
MNKVKKKWIRLKKDGEEENNINSVKGEKKIPVLYCS